MHIYNRIRTDVKKIAKDIVSFTPYIFIILVIFSFGEVYAAVLTVISAILHEGGHVLAMATLGRGFSVSGVMSGLRLKPKSTLSYGEEIFVASAGPAVNLILFIIFIFTGGGYLSAFALVNLFTALSNLLPIRGYDGYRIAVALISRFGDHSFLYSLFSYPVKHRKQ